MYVFMSYDGTNVDWVTGERTVKLQRRKQRSEWLRLTQLCHVQESLFSAPL